MDSSFQEYLLAKQSNDALNDDFHNYCLNKGIESNVAILEQENAQLRRSLEHYKQTNQELQEILYNMNMYHSVCIKRYTNVLRFVYAFKEFRIKYLNGECNIENTSTMIKELINNFEQNYLTE